MDLILSELEFQLFKRFINEKCGIEISDDKAYLIESRLTKILVDSKLSSFGELYNHIRYSKDEKLIGKLIDAITTNETLWFRDKTPWKILEDLYIPKYIDLLRSGERNRIHIWSAATSTGQEAYSTAICIQNYLKTRFVKDITLKQFEIIGTDISSLVLQIAKKGRYDNISIKRGLDKTIRDRYFINQGSVWEIDDEIKQAVSFKQFNLQDSFLHLGKFDVIFCRYVLIYFSNELKFDVINRLFDSLLNDGILFLGAYEMCNYLNNCFTTKQLDNGTYYTKLIEKEGV